jgi:hypothetical protein
VFHCYVLPATLASFFDDVSHPPPNVFHFVIGELSGLICDISTSFSSFVKWYTCQKIPLDLIKLIHSSLYNFNSSIYHYKICTDYFFWQMRRTQYSFIILTNFIHYIDKLVSILTFYSFCLYNLLFCIRFTDFLFH